MADKDDKNTTITMAHGSGGRDSAALMSAVFGKYFANETLDRLEDAAVVTAPGVSEGGGRIVVSTDSFVVTPLEFPGGDIGKLAVCGTVNDVLMMGAVPRWLTCGFVLEEGLEIAVLDRVVASMACTAAEAGVTIIAGDTKVVERRAAGEPTASATGAGVHAADFGSPAAGLFVNTTGIGFLRPEIASGKAAAPEAAAARAGDAVIVSGSLGDHHACILSQRLGLENGIRSDCGVMAAVTDALYKSGAEIHTMRDVTRGGLATVLNEIASSSSALIELDETALPVNGEVRAFCGIMGLDPVYMGNEGKIVAIVDGAGAEKALDAVRRTDLGRDARIIGRVAAAPAPESGVVMKTRIGGTRRVPVLQGEGLPRIC